MDFEICNIIITCNNYHQQYTSLRLDVLQECISCSYRATESWVICYCNILSFTTFPQVAIKSLLRCKLNIWFPGLPVKISNILRKSTTIILYEYKQILLYGTIHNFKYSLYPPTNEFIKVPTVSTQTIRSLATTVS